MLIARTTLTGSAVILLLQAAAAQAEGCAPGYHKGGIGGVECLRNADNPEKPPPYQQYRPSGISAPNGSGSGSGQPHSMSAK